MEDDDKFITQTDRFVSPVLTSKAVYPSLCQQNTDSRLMPGLELACNITKYIRKKNAVPNRSQAGNAERVHMLCVSESLLGGRTAALKKLLVPMLNCGQSCTDSGPRTGSHICSDAQTKHSQCYFLS